MALSQIRARQEKRFPKRCYSQVLNICNISISNQHLKFCSMYQNVSVRKINVYTRRLPLHQVAAQVLWSLKKLPCPLEQNFASKLQKEFRNIQYTTFLHIKVRKFAINTFVLQAFYFKYTHFKLESATKVLTPKPICG